MSAALLSSGFKGLIGAKGQKGKEYEYLLPQHLRNHTHDQTGAERRDAHFDGVKKRNQERAQMEEKIVDEALDTVAHKSLVSKAHKWRMIELAAVISSMVGLVIAILDYELCMYYGGYKGITAFTDVGLYKDGKMTVTKEMIATALSAREEVPYTRTLRWANFVSCWVTIALLAWRNTAKTRWTNSEYNKEIWLEERGRQPS